MEDLAFGQPDGGVVQLAYVTRDIESAMRDMSASLGVGPWFLFERFELQELRYRGQPADFEVTLALGNSGAMQFELIVALDDRPSPYRELLETRGEGFHHYGVGVHDFDAAARSYVAAGSEEVLSARAGVGARARYFEGGACAFGMVELIEMTPQVQELWTVVQDAARRWDGAEPVRTLG